MRRRRGAVRVGNALHAPGRSPRRRTKHAGILAGTSVARVRPGAVALCTGAACLNARVLRAATAIGVCAGISWGDGVTAAMTERDRPYESREWHDPTYTFANHERTEVPRAY